MVDFTGVFHAFLGEGSLCWVFFFVALAVKGSWGCFHMFFIPFFFLSAVF